MTFGKPDGQCLLATTSKTCPKDCILNEFGNVGPLLVNETCDEEKKDWGGCHIKADQGKCNIQSRLICIF